MFLPLVKNYLNGKRIIFVTHADNSFAVHKLVVVHLTTVPDSLLISFHLLGEKLDAGNGLLLVVSIADDLVQVSQVAHRVPHKSDQKKNRRNLRKNINFQNLGNVIISSMCNLPPMCCQRFLHSG